MTASISRIRFHNFKAFKSFGLSLNEFNVLVGPNNSGKSTVIDGLRALEVALLRASRRNATPLSFPNAGGYQGWQFPLESLPLSVENVHTNYDQSVPTYIEFRLTNNIDITLFFPTDEPFCNAFILEYDRLVSTAQAVRNRIDFSITCTPVLGQLEHNEQLVGPKVVDRNLNTHRAPRNFRNYWMLHDDEFDQFSRLMSETWPELSVQIPEKMDLTTLAMFCVEGPTRQHREIYWAGFGYQVWAQLMTHILRAGHGSLLVVDEPETYLHPDLQRKYLALCRQIPGSVIVATHSAEIVTEADPGDLVLVDKTRRLSKRLTGPTGVMTALSTLGARRNLELTRLARTRKAVYVEGADFKLLRRFAARARHGVLAGSADVTDIVLGGHRPEDAIALSAGIKEALGAQPRACLILDRDFRCDEEISELETKLKDSFEHVFILRRKEIENFLLDIPSIQTAVEELAAARKVSADRVEDVETVIRSITDPLVGKMQGQLIARAQDYHRRTGSGLELATIAENVVNDCNAKWMDMDRRIEVIPGKDVFAGVAGHYQESIGVNLTADAVIEEMPKESLPAEFLEMLNKLERFASSSNR